MDRPALSYATPAPAKIRLAVRIDRIGKLIVLLSLLLVLPFLFPVLRYGCLAIARGLHEKFVHATEERACRHYIAPPTRIVYEEDPTAAALLSQDGYTTVRVPHSQRPAATIYIPSCWRAYNSPGLSQNAVLFLHELPSNSGPRLICIELCTDYEFCLSYDGHFHTPPIPAYTPGSLRFYAGQLDPADPSRFTIRYAVDGKEGLMRGRMKGDMVEWEFFPPSSSN